MEIVTIDEHSDDGEPPSNVVAIKIFESDEFSETPCREVGESLVGVAIGEAI